METALTPPTKDSPNDSYILKEIPLGETFFLGKSGHNYIDDKEINPPNVGVKLKFTQTSYGATSVLARPDAEVELATLRKEKKR